MGRVYGVGKYGAGLYGGGSVASLETKLKGFISDPIILLEIDLPSGSIYFGNQQARFSTQNYEGSILEIGQVKRSMQQNLGIYETSSIEIVIADTNSAILQLEQVTQFKNAPARLKIGNKSTALDSYYVFHQGRVDDFGSTEFGFHLIIQDHLWTLPQNPDSDFVTETKFARALPAHKGKPIPICYGVHFDDGTTSDGTTNDFKNAGAWPTLFVDVSATKRRFLIAGHAIKSIDTVYATTPGRGTLTLTPVTDYTAYTAGFINGKRYAFIELAGTSFDNKVVDTAGNLGEVTVNVNGKTTAEDGTGTLLTNPIDVLKDVLNIHLGSPPINADKFAQAVNVAASRGYNAAGGYVLEKGTDQFLKELLDSFSIRLFPDSDGNVSVDIYEPSGPFDVIKTILEGRDILENSWNLDFSSSVQGAEDAKIINEVNYIYNMHWRTSNFRKTDKKSDANSILLYGSKKLNISMPWARDITSASDVAQRYVFLYRNAVPHVTFRLPLLGLDIELSDQVNLSHKNAPIIFGWVDQRCEVISRSFNPTSFTNEIRARDVSSISAGGYFLDSEAARVRVSDGTVGVVNASGVITATGATSFITAGVSVNDIIRLKTVVNEGNRKNLKVTAVTATTVTVSNTVWTNESSIVYEIIPSWLTAATTQKLYGHLCDEATGLFSNANAGFRLL